MRFGLAKALDMQDSLIDLAKSPIPVVLVAGGLFFLFAAIIGHYAFATPVPRQRQIIAGIVGGILLVIGIGLYFVPSISTQIRTAGGVQVSARKDWQSSGYQITTGAEVQIEVIDGQWTSRKGTILYTSGEGTGYICGEVMPPEKCVEPLPTVPSDALIGRIGDQLFLIGQGTTISAEQSGPLELRINDGSGGLYDNDGVLTVSVSTD
jgi:hypothetical protein